MRTSINKIYTKSGKDYKVHSALDKFLATPLYNIPRAIVFSNERTVLVEAGITYMPIYYCMFLLHPSADHEAVILPDIEMPELS